MVSAVAASRIFSGACPPCSGKRRLWQGAAQAELEGSDAAVYLLKYI